MNVAFVFPGQGSQSVGMMAPFETLPAVRRTFDEAGAALGMDLWALVRDGPEQELSKTVNTQPAMLAAGSRVVPRVEGAGRNRSGRGGGPQPGRIRGPGCGGRTGLCRGRTLGAVPCAGHAGSGPRRARRHRRAPRTGPGSGPCGVSRGERRWNRRGGQFQLTRAGGHRGTNGGRATRDRVGQGARRQARDVAGHERAFPLQPHASRRRAPARTAGAYQRSGACDTGRE